MLSTTNGQQMFCISAITKWVEKFFRDNDIFSLDI